MANHCDHFHETTGKVSYEWKIEKFLTRNYYNWKLNSPKFMICDANFCIQIHPQGNDKDIRGWVSIFLEKEFSRTEYRVDYTLGLKCGDGSVFKSRRCCYLFSLTTQGYGFQKFVERSKLTSAEKDVFGPSGTLTIFCEVHKVHIPAVGDDSLVEDNDSSVETETQASLMDSIETLSKNFEKIYVSGCQTDIVIDVRGEKFSAHRSILSARSSVFRAMFELDIMKGRKTGEVSIDDCDPESFGSFLMYLYSGRLDVVSSDNALALYTTADKYNVQELKKECCESLDKDLSVNSVCDVLGLATLHEEQELLKSAINYFVKNANKILRTLKWQTLWAENPNLAHELFIKVADTLKDSAIKTLS